MDQTPPLRRVQRVRHELKRRELVVARTQRIGASFVAVTLTGESLADFRSDSFDDHVKVFLPSASGELQGRDYTPRSFDRERRELTIEFLLHGDGPGASWAAQAAPGQPLLVGGPRGTMIVPVDYAWHLLAGDASALPAMHRRLEELPAGARALVVAQVDSAADERMFRTDADLQLQWVHGTDAFLGAVERLTLPPGEGYAWCAGEAAVMRRVRGIVLDGKRQPHEAARIAAYWKKGAVAHHENLD